MGKMTIEEYVLTSKKEMVIQMDVAYTLLILNASIPDETLNQVAHTLRKSCDRLYDYSLSVGIDHVRIAVAGKIGKPDEILGEDYNKLIAFCAINALNTKCVSHEDIVELFKLPSRECLWSMYPELCFNNGELKFKHLTPMRQIIKLIK